MARILVIDDDPLYRDMVSETLVDEGHDVQMAENGLEGIDKARAFVPELVVSDVVMEGADGYQVLATLRSEPATASVPFILMTGWSSKGGQRQGMSMGADDYLPKPFNASELLDTVRAQLRKKERFWSQASTRSSFQETGLSVFLPAEISRSLHALHGAASIMSRPRLGLDPDDILSLGTTIESAAWKIQRAVDNVVLFEQLLRLEHDQKGKRSLRDERIADAGALIEQRARALASSRGRETDLHLALKPGSLAMAPEYLGRIVDELVDNACQFSEPGSAVEIVTAFAPERFGLAITDHGRGMSEEEIHRIDAFIQFGRRDVDQQGLGLGLAIARQIALLHGGSLSIKSKVGEKTRVSVELPVRV